MINNTSNPISATPQRFHRDINVESDEKTFKENLFDLLINKSLKSTFEDNKELKLSDRKWNLHRLDHKIKQLSLSNKIKRSIKIHNLISKLKKQRELYCNITKSLSKLPTETRNEIISNFISENDSLLVDQAVGVNVIPNDHDTERNFTKKELKRLDLEASLSLLKVLKNKDVSCLYLLSYQIRTISQNILPILLESCKSLDTLEFSETLFYEEGKFYSLGHALKTPLKQNIPLMNLTINGNIFAPDAMQHLKEGIRRNTNLKLLELFECRQHDGIREDYIHTQFLDVSPILEAMEENTSLETLAISESDVKTLNAIYLLNEGLKSSSALTDLNLYDCRLPNNSGLIIGSGLPKYTKLTCLRLGKIDTELPSPTTNELLAICRGLAFNKSITSLSLDAYDDLETDDGGFRFNDEALNHLGGVLNQNKTLKILSLDYSLDQTSLEANRMFSTALFRNLTIERVRCSHSFGDLQNLNQADQIRQLSKSTLFQMNGTIASINRQQQFRTKLHSLLYNLDEQNNDHSDQNETLSNFDATALHFIPHLDLAMRKSKLKIYNEERNFDRKVRALISGLEQHIDLNEIGPYNFARTAKDLKKFLEVVPK